MARRKPKTNPDGTPRMSVRVIVARPGCLPDSDAYPYWVPMDEADEAIAYEYRLSVPVDSCVPMKEVGQQIEEAQREFRENSQVRVSLPDGLEMVVGR